MRKFNSKLYDQKLDRIIQESSNGRDSLKTEIRNSRTRLEAVKCGVLLSELVKEKDETFYTPLVDTYFKGHDRKKRNKRLAAYQEEEGEDK